MLRSSIRFDPISDGHKTEKVNGQDLAKNAGMAIRIPHGARCQCDDLWFYKQKNQVRRARKRSERGTRLESQLLPVVRHNHYQLLTSVLLTG